LKEEITSIKGVGQFASEEEKHVTECGDGVSVAIDPLDGSFQLFLIRGILLSNILPAFQKT